MFATWELQPNYINLNYDPSDIVSETPCNNEYLM